MMKNFLKTLWRHKMASALNIIGLGVAFAAFAVIIAGVRYDLTYDGFHKDGDRIFRVEMRNELSGGGADAVMANVQRPLMAVMKNIAPQIERAVLFNPNTGNMPFSTPEFDGGQTFDVPQMQWAGELTEVFDFDIVSGSLARLDEPRTIMIPSSMALRVFGTEDAAGKTLTVEIADKYTVEVIAVFRDFPENSLLRQNSGGGAGGMIFRQMPADQNLTSWSNFNYNMFLKLVTPDPSGVIENIRNASADAFPDREWMKEVITLTGIRELHFNKVQYDWIPKASRTTVYTLLSIAILIVLIAAINFVNFATSMVPVRLRGVNTRRVLGSSVGSVRAEMIVEAVGLAVIGFALGVAALWALNIEVKDNVPVLAATFAVAVVAGILAGIYPAWYIASFPPALVLKGSFGLSPQGKKLRTVLVSVQYVISFVLIIAALSIRAQNDFMKNYPLGFDRENLLTVILTMTIAQSPDAFRTELMKNPAIEGVEYSQMSIVASGGMGWGRGIQGRGEEGGVNFDVQPVSPGFVKLLGFEITDGRDFTPADDLSAVGTFIFNETARQQFDLSLESMVGAHTEEYAPVVGFVNDFYVRPLHNAVSPFALYVYGTNPWNRLDNAYIRVAAGADIAEVSEFIRAAAKTIDPAAPDLEVRFLDESVGNLYGKEQALSRQITLFSLLAVLISVIGVFGLILFETQYRRKEIGLRRVHGARVGEILQMLNRRFVWIVLVCFVVAAPLGWLAVQRWMEGFAYRAGGLWWTFAVALLLVLAITVLTVTLQSLKAANENPAKTININH